MKTEENKSVKGFQTLLGTFVIAVLALVLLPLLRGGTATGGDRKAVADAEIIARAVMDYRQDTGSWPASEGGFMDPACLSDPNLAPGTAGQALAAGMVGTNLAGGGEPLARPWLEEVPLDPWYRPYRVQLVPTTGSSGRIVVVSTGPDGQLQTDPFQLKDDASGPATSCRGDDLGYVLPPAAWEDRP